MATPHVSGLVAYLLGLDSSLSPAEVEATIKNQALNNVISGVREYHPPTLSFSAPQLISLFQLEELLTFWLIMPSEPPDPLIISRVGRIIY